jgi:hypothetical protein
MDTNRLICSLVLVLSLALRALAADSEDCALEQYQREAATLDETWGTANCVGSSLPLFFAGADVTFFAVDARTGGHASLSLDDTNSAGTDVTLAGADGLNDLGYAPRVWLGGRIIEDWYVVGRYWRLDDSGINHPEAPAGTINLANFLRLSGPSSVEAFTADLEVQHTFDLGRWQIDGFVGARHASLDASSHLTTSGAFTAGSTAQVDLFDRSSFEGTGVTSGLVVRRQISDSNFNVFFGARGSRADGTSNSFGRVAVSVSAPPGSMTNSNEIERSDINASMTIAELQTGVEYEIQLSFIPACAFFQIAYEYQNWNIDGHPATGPSISGPVNNVQVAASASPGIGDLNLNGLTLATGLAW